MFENQLDEVLTKYPKLSKQTFNNTIILKGDIDIVDENEKVWDTYEIEIRPTQEFPNRFPELFEVGGKIPNNPDWHIYTDGSCCVTVLPNELLVCKKGITVLGYVEQFVIPYLANQTYRRLTGNFANGEYSHGVLGLVEFYQELLKTKNLEEIIGFVEWVFNNPKPNRTNFCFCGSNKKFRHCHKESYNKLVLLGKEQVYYDLKI